MRLHRRSRRGGNVVDHARYAIIYPHSRVVLYVLCPARLSGEAGGQWGCTAARET